MPDDIPPAPSETSEDAAKAETIRITLPDSPGQPPVKRETVRINLPGKPAPTTLSGVGPKKETTKIPVPEGATGTPLPAPAAPPPSAARPFVPPPPRPPSSLGATPLKPQSGVTPPPKPPSLGVKPTIPLKPTPAPTTIAKPVAPAGSGLNPPPEPVTQKAASPKKETARITLPPEGGKPGMPKATIKMQQTQPLVKQPGASQSGIQSAPTLTTTSSAALSAGEPAADGMITVLSIVALVASLISVFLVYLAYSASSLS